MKEGVEVNVLLASGGRRVELLRAFKRAYDELSLPGKIITVDVDPLAPALMEAHRYYMVPPISDPEYVPTLAKICTMERIDLIFPHIESDILLLSSRRKELEATGARVVVVPQETARIAEDKWDTYNFFVRLNIPTPRTWLPERARDACLQYPLFIKPRFGSAARNTFKVQNRRELNFFLSYVPEPIIQEYLPGPEITNDVFCDFEGDVLAVVSRERIEVRWGEVAKAKTIFDPGILKHCVRIAKEMKAIGPINIQCMMRDGHPFYTDINPRFGGGVPLTIAAGAPLPKWSLILAAGGKIVPPPLGSYQVGLFLTRYDDSFFLTKEAHEEIASHRI